MAPYISRDRASIFVLLASLVLPFILLDYSSSVLFASAKSPKSKDADLLEFALNLEYLEAEFFLFGALGHGLDVVAPNLTGGGPLPIGAKKVELDDLTNDVILQFAFQEVGHLRAIKSKVTGFPRPLLDLSSKSFAKLMDNAFGKPLVPPFDPYANSLNFIIASYVIPYVGLTGYVGANRLLESATSRELVAGLLGVESGQDAILRELLYERKEQLVPPYGVAVEEFTNRISILRSKLGNRGLKDEGIVVPFGLGAEGKVRVAPNLTEGGPPPIGGKLAKLDNFVKDVIFQFALQEVGHLRAIKRTVKGFPRPLLDLSATSFAQVMDNAIGHPLLPSFDPYANSINFLLASYVIPYVGLTGYVGANPLLQNAASRKLVAGLLGVESGQDAVIRALLYEHRASLVHPYGLSVEVFTDRISMLRNKLGNKDLKDEGLIVPKVEGAEGNILAGDINSLAYPRTPEEILRIIYGGGDEHFPGDFYSRGASGRIATSYLNFTT